MMDHRLPRVASSNDGTQPPSGGLLPEDLPQYAEIFACLARALADHLAGCLDTELLDALGEELIARRDLRDEGPVKYWPTNPRPAS